jgi:hypothetical protein
MAIDKKLKERLKAIDKIRDELTKAEKSAAKDIMGLLKDLMGKNPNLTGMRWTQYTPHFNDGDACEFGINEPEYQFGLPTPAKDEDEDDGYGSNEGWYDSYQIDEDFFKKRTDVINFKEIPAVQKSVKEAHQVWEKLTSMDKQLQTMFGDGVQVTVTADGVEVEEYDHD